MNYLEWSLKPSRLCTPDGDEAPLLAAMIQASFRPASVAAFVCRGKRMMTIAEGISHLDGKLT